MKRVFSLLLVIGIQLFLVCFFFVKVVKDDVNVSKFASVAYNENLDKISTSVSLLFKEEIVKEVELIDDTLLEMTSSDTDKESVKEVKKDEKNEDEIVSTPLITVDSSKYKDNLKMGFKVTENNKNYSFPRLFTLFIRVYCNTVYNYLFILRCHFYLFSFVLR